MRAICLALLVMNLLAFAYQWFFDDPRVQSSEQPQAELKPGEGLRLLSESEMTGTSVSEQKARPEAPIPLNSSSQSMCMLVGPFERPEEAESLVERLLALEVSAAVDNIEVSDGTGYWVHLPPELSERAALRRLHELQAKDVDSYVIPRGDLARGISLGMFSREELALRRQQEVQELGYKAQIAEIPRTHREIWVSMPFGQASQIADRFWSRLLKEGSDLKKRQNFCPGVASRAKFH